MKLNRIIAATLAALLCWCAPALAGIALIPGSGTPFVAYGNSASGLTTVSTSAQAATAAVPIGSLVYIDLTVGSNTATFTSCSDSVGNSYSTPSNNASSSTKTNAYAFGITTVLAPIGTTWTCNLSSNPGGKGIIVAAASGVAASSPHDAASATPANGTGTAIAVGPTGTLSCPGGGSGCEIIYASWAYVTTGTDSGFTAGFTLVGCDTGNSSNHCLYYQIVSATTALSFAATHSVSTAWAANLEAFVGTGVAPPLQGGTLLRGAGR